MTSACSSGFLETRPGPRELQVNPGEEEGRDLTFAPRHLKSHFTETPFTRPLDYDLIEATEPIQATRWTAAATQWADSAGERAGRLASTHWGAGRGGTHRTLEVERTPRARWEG